MSSGTLPVPTETGRHRGSRSDAARAAIERGIVEAIAYADVFDYPLTADEVHRYLVGVPATRASVRSVLSSSPALADVLARRGRYFALAGREGTFEVRRARASLAEAYWRRAVRYGHTIGNLPFVRMVAVTGALAMDNVADGDIDYLVVTEPQRLWLCRALVVGLVRTAALRRVDLCPNYFLSERALVLDERNLFTAHEVAQMVPLTGVATYQRLRALNRWTDSYLPNAGNRPRRVTPVEPRPRRTRRILESTLRSPLGSPLERWEMARKVRKLGQRGHGHAEAAFGPDWCKGHFGDHGQLTLSRYGERLQALGWRLP